MCKCSQQLHFFFLFKLFLGSIWKDGERLETVSGGRLPIAAIIISRVSVENASDMLTSSFALTLNDSKNPFSFPNSRRPSFVYKWSKLDSSRSLIISTLLRQRTIGMCSSFSATTISSTSSFQRAESLTDYRSVMSATIITPSASRQKFLFSPL